MKLVLQATAGVPNTHSADGLFAARQQGGSGTCIKSKVLPVDMYIFYISHASGHKTLRSDLGL